MNLETILLIALAAFSAYVVWAKYKQDTLPLIVRRKSLAKLATHVGALEKDCAYNTKALDSTRAQLRHAQEKLEKQKARYNALELDCDGTTKALESTRHTLSRCEEDLKSSDDAMKLAEHELKKAERVIERRIVGDYPVAYWGYREVFSYETDEQWQERDDWPFRNPSALDVDPNAGAEADPFKVISKYLMRFSLREHLSLGCLDNHSTVRMASGIYITFHDGKAIMGDDIYLMDRPYHGGDIGRNHIGQDKLPAPMLVWSENHQQWFERISRYEHHPSTPYSLIVS